jgi:hypothetical protein
MVEHALGARSDEHRVWLRRQKSAIAPRKMKLSAVAPGARAAAMAFMTRWLNSSATNECSLSVSDANLPPREFLKLERMIGRGWFRCDRPVLLIPKVVLTLSIRLVPRVSASTPTALTTFRRGNRRRQPFDN